MTADGGMGAFAAIFGGYGLPLPGDIFIKDGKTTNSLYEPEMVEALKEVKKIIEAGVVDPELLVNTGNQWHDKVIQGKTGIAWAGWPRMTKGEFVGPMEAVNPEVDWVQIETPVGPYGRYAGGESPSINMRGLPSTLAKDPEKLEKIFELLNYISTEEGNRLVAYGLEGRHFNLENGKVVPTDLMSHWTGKTKGGFYQEILDRSADGSSKVTINPEKLKTVMLEMLAEAGVKLQLYTFAADAIVEDNKIKGIITESKSGREAIMANVIIDASGDGDIAARAGVPYQKGRASDGKMQPMTLMFKVAGVDTVLTHHPKK